MSEASAAGILPSSSAVGTRKWWSWWGATAPLTAVMIIVLGGLVIPPIAVLTQQSLTEALFDGSRGAFTFEHYERLFADPKLYVSARNSVTFATLSTIFALAFGGIIAWVVERTNAPLRGLAYLTTIISLGMPFILYVLAWLFLLGRAGPLNDFYRNLTGSTDTLFAVHSMAGMVLVETFSWLPLVFLLFSATFRASNAEMEEAARMSGASIIATVWHVSLKLARPAILATALFVFIRSLEAFDVPMLIGTPAGINLLTSDIFFSIRAVPPDLGHASAFSVLLTVVIAILMYFYGRISRSADRYATVTGKGYRPRPFDLGRWRWVGSLLVLLHFAVMLGLPLLGLLWVSVMPFVRPIRFAALPFATLKNYEAVFKVPAYLTLTWHTLVIAAAAATLGMALMVVTGWLVARRKPGATFLDQLTTMPLLLPGIVLGVAMMEIALRSPVPLYGTLAIIVIAFVVRYMPYGMRYAFSGVLQIHRELEEAAGVAGASTLTVLRRIVAPLLSPAIAAGWLFIFLNAAKELSIPILLSGPNTQTMAVAIFEQSTNGQFSELAALGLLWTLLMTVFAVVFYLLMRRQSSSAYR
ncbi:MAG: iron ABC transporter permease [Rhodospirillaceae bacterium]|nr:iron ABC transporter permease [Rhodospirillaceae bacterium]